MRAARMLLGAALFSLSALALHAPGLAGQKAATVAQDPSSTAARDEATNKALLKALLQRRAEIAQLPFDATRAEGRRYALEFLDRQIAKVRKDVEESQPSQ